MYWIIPAAIIGAVLLFALTITLVCFFKIYYSPRRKHPGENEYPTPEGEIYDPYRPQMVEWIKGIRRMDYTEVSVTSFDGLRLCGRYYEQRPGDPIEILFHGYRGTSERDLCGGIYRCFALGHNALIVDHRAHGFSEGHIITFGAKESRDCLTWVDFVINNINKDAKIILTGISMGAATVMTAASMDLPPSVVGILADCGYTSTDAIIQKVIRDMRLPPAIIYPFARLAARVLGGFDTEGAAPIKSMRECRLPIIFFHGDTDAYVPHEMSIENYNACTSENKRLVITPGAGHGLCFPADMEGYIAELHSFFDPIILCEKDEAQQQ